MAELTMKDIIAAHQERKRRLEALEEAHKEATAPLRQEISLLEGAAHKLLQRDGAQSMGIKGIGTAYREKYSKAKVEDAKLLREWALRNKRLDIFPAAVNKTVVQAEIDRIKEETGEDYTGCPVPGVEMEYGWTCKIRKSAN